MKTTVEISDALFEEARRLAARQGVSLRQLIEEGLRRIVTERRRKADFRLRKATFRGQGLQPEVADGLWERIRDLVYRGRGT